MAQRMKKRCARAPAVVQDRASAEPRAPAKPPPPPAILRPAVGAGLIFGGAYTAAEPLANSNPLEGRELSRTAEAWGWCEWLRVSLLLAALAAACLALAPETISQRALAQAARRPNPLLAFAGSIAQPAAADHIPGPAAIGAIHYWSDDDSTTITVGLPSLVFFESHRLAHPSRVYFDLAGTEMPAELQGRVIQVEVGQTWVRKIRVAQWKPGVTRVVLETTSNCDYSAMIASDPYRLMVKLNAPK